MQPRVNRGIPTGGQFSAHQRGEADVTLGGAGVTTGAETPAAILDHRASGNPGASTESLAAIAKRTTSEVTKIDIALHPNTDARTINDLARDRHPLVADAARQRSEYAPRTARERIANSFSNAIRGRAA